MHIRRAFEFGPFRLLPSERLLLRGEEVVELPPKVFDTLVVLVENSGHVIEKGEMMRSVWPDSFVADSSLTRIISLLRKSLRESEYHYIETVPKVGYRFVASVREMSESSADLIIERLAMSKTTTIEEEEISLGGKWKAAALDEALRQRLRGAWGVKAGLLVAALAVAAVLGNLLLESNSKDDQLQPQWRNAKFTQITDQAEEELFPSLSPDGKFVVYSSNATGNWDIYLQRIGGRNPINLTASSSDYDTHPAFSPDGERIAFRSSREGGGIFVMGTTGESVRRIADFGYNPAWSPDGAEIVCAEGKVLDPTNRSHIPSRLWAINVATGEKRFVADGDAVQPHWSPNGHRIAYWGLRKGGQRDIWTVPRNGGEPMQVTDDMHFDWNPVWSPDGKHLYFASDRAGSMNLWRVAIEEESGKVLGNAEPVTTPSSYSQHISFSRDGRRIAYAQVTSRVSIKQVAFDPVKESLAGEPVFVTQGHRRTTSPDLSPDGQRVVFDSQGETREDIFVIRSDGTELRQLTDDVYRDREPRWSPDGRQVAFYSDRSGRYEIWIINIDGTGLKQITHNSNPIAYYPVWSPDGNRLAYKTRGNLASIVEIDGQGEQQPLKSLPPLTDGLFSRFTPWSWSADGQKMAGWQASDRDPHSGIVIFSLDSKRFERLTDIGNRPVWLSDNRRLIFFYHDKLYLLDSLSRKAWELLSAAPHQIQGLGLSDDDRLICFSLRISESDIWLSTLD